jgi:hypothetical protein
LSHESCGYCLFILIGWFGFDELRVFRVEGDGTDWCPVSGVPSPTPWIGGLRREIQVMPCSQNLVVLAGMPLIWAHVADSAVQMLDVVPVYELAGPSSGLIQIFESTSDILRPVLGGSEG